VISVPKRLRGFLADRPAAVTALARIFLAEIERLLDDAVGPVHDATARPSLRPRLGAVSFLHRFGSALNRHVHLHACVTDGLFRPDEVGVAFLPARTVTPTDLATPTERVRRRVVRWFLRKGLLDARTARRHRPLALRVSRPPGRPRATAAETPPSLPRRLRPESPAQARRHGAGDRQSRHTGRRRMSLPPGEGRSEGAPDAQSRSHDTSRIAWAKLIARIAEDFPLACPACGGDIRLIAFIIDPAPVRKILLHLGEPLDPPPLAPPRGPPTSWAELTQVHDDSDAIQSSHDDLPVIDIRCL